WSHAEGPMKSASCSVTERTLEISLQCSLLQCPGARRVVSEGSMTILRVRRHDFPADCPHRSDFHCSCRYPTRDIRQERVPPDTPEFPAYSRVVSLTVTGKRSQ